jgi:DNA-binding response OmpR family regulator
MSLSATPLANILLVESEPQLLKFVRTILARSGFQVLAAKNAEDAMRIAQGFEAPIDLLLTGCCMPRLSGPALAEKLAQRPGLRVMLMSGEPASSTIALQHGWHFIQKPFLIPALIDAIQFALAPNMLGRSILGRRG